MNQNLGHATAYGYARSKGYTGTEEEFAELMASYASVAESAAASATAAAASATTATTKAGEAATSATAAGTAKTAAQTAQSNAETAATTATTQAGNAASSATTASTKASEAAGSASTASTKASEAATSATNAASSATAAAGSATTATTKAAEAAASADDAAQSAASLVIDDTLTHAGQAADAKKTGDEISSLNEDLSSVEEELNFHTEETPLSITEYTGGFSGDIGDTITTNGQTAWKRTYFSVEENAKYRITFYNREGLSSDVAYIDGVDENNIIKHQYAVIPHSQATQNNEVIVEPDIDVATLYVRGRKTSGTPYPITATKLQEVSDIPVMQDDITEAQVQLNTVSSNYNHGPFDIKRNYFTHYYTGMQSDYSNFDRDSKYADVISAFDALMAEAPDYISKNALGTASGTDSGGNSYTLYEYVFKPKRKTSPYYTAKMPKLYMDGSIHGFEKNSTYGLYYFLKDLVENFADDESLLYFRTQVEIHIVPVVNPYGFDNYIYKNANSVNINRNFDHPGEWIPVESGSDQNGLAPFDQPESAIIRDWLLASENDILMYFNCHTNGSATSGYNEMNPCMTSNDRNDSYFNKLFDVFTNHIEIQTAVLPDMYPSIRPASNEMCGTITSSETSTSTKGTASAWADTMRTMLSMTLEVFNGLTVDGETVIGQYSAESKKICSEIMGNLFIQVLSEYSPY